MELISKEEVMKIIRKHNDWYGGYDERVHDITEKINSLPTTEERKKGKWIRPKRSLWHMADCSICGVVSMDIGNYCPKCGAKMEGAEE